MKKIFETIEFKPVPVIIGLFIFHIALASTMHWLAHSPYFTHLHNGQGFWNFARDSTLYQDEALTLLDTLNSGNWEQWWAGIDLPNNNRQIKHAHVKWITLIYWISGEKSPLIFEIVNSATWVISVILVFLAARVLFNNNVKVAVFSVLYLFFPSVLLSSTQLLRDPFYILGFCSTIFGWTTIFHENSKWQGVFALVLGFFLITVIRSYVAPLLLIIFFICSIIFLLKRKISLFPATVMLVSLFFIYSLNGSSMFKVSSNPVSSTSSKGETKTTTKSPAKNKTPKSAIGFQDIVQEIWGITGETPEGVNDKNLKRNTRDLQKEVYSKVAKLYNTDEQNNITGMIRYLNKRVAIRLSMFRYGFKTVNSTASSIIDENVLFMNLRDLFSYFPRALQIGFLSPFPHLWVSPGSETGHIGRIMAGFETLIVYIVLIGFCSTFFIDVKTLESVTPVLLFSAVFIILLGFVIPNVGALYRMRQGLLIPFFMIGVYGLRLLFLKINTRGAKTDT
jgi:hypothetical protein